MSVLLNLQNSFAGLRRIISPHRFSAQGLKTGQSRVPQKEATRRSLTTSQKLADELTLADHPGLQHGKNTIPYTFWKATSYPQQASKTIEARPSSSKPAIGLGWPTLYQWIDQFEDMRSLGPRNRIIADKAHPSSDYANNETLWDAINGVDKEQDPHQLLSAMLKASTGPESMPHMASSRFRSMLCRLGPEHFIEPYQQSVAPNAEADLKRWKTSHTISMFRHYVKALLTLVGRRRASGCEVSLEEYRMLLSAAAAARSHDIASHIWIAMLEDRIEPDLACYNLLFEALCHASTHSRPERVRLRLIPLHIIQHRRPSSSHSSHLYGTNGVCETVVYWYNHMCNRDVSPDADTYGFVMVALGRFKSMEDVKRLVRGTWDIDLDNISRNRPQTPESFKLSIDPSCTPKPSTLRHLMHVMCANNQLPEAIAAVEYMAELYSIRIPIEAWEELVVWTGALSAHRTSGQISSWKGYGIAQVKKSTMREVWKTISAEPYNVKPTMRILDALCSNASRRMALTELLEYVRDGVRIYQHQLRNYLEALHNQAEGILLTNTRGKTINRLSEFPSQHQLHHAVKVAEAKERVSFSKIRRWFVLLLHGNRFMGNKTADNIVCWDRQIVPDLVQELWHFRPIGIQYSPQQLDDRGKAQGKGGIQFEAESSDLAEWGQLQGLLDFLPRGTNAQLPSISAMRRKLDACKQRGIDSFITEILGAEQAKEAQENAVQQSPTAASSMKPSMPDGFRLMYHPVAE